MTTLRDISEYGRILRRKSGNYRFTLQELCTMGLALGRATPWQREALRASAIGAGATPLGYARSNALQGGQDRVAANVFEVPGAKWPDFCSALAGAELLPPPVRTRGKSQLGAILAELQALREAILPDPSLPYSLEPTAGELCATAFAAHSRHSGLCGDYQDFEAGFLAAKRLYCADLDKTEGQNASGSNTPVGISVCGAQGAEGAGVCDESKDV